MITAEVIHKVVRIRFGTERGSGFIANVDGREYLVTAKHVVNDAPEKLGIDVFTTDGWKTYPSRLVGHADGHADVSVIATEERLGPPQLSLHMSSTGVSYGQDVYFLGFPYEYRGLYATGNPGEPYLPMPFVKKAILSQFGKGYFVLDGHNNPGFSGGPVVFKNKNGVYQVMAVVHGFVSVAEPVVFGGVPEEKRSTDIHVRSNTGLMIAWDTKSAEDMIAANPIGLPVA